MEARLDSIDSARRHKARVIARDYEDKFYAPLQTRIRDQIRPDQYGKFTAQKTVAIQSMDTDPIPIRSSREPRSLPVIRVSTRGLPDHSHRYAQKKAKEEEFAKRIAAECGNPIVEVEKPQRDTLDYRLFGLQRETRFFDGGPALPKGKRFFEKSETFDCARNAFDDFR
jgi:hypothetical protein